MQDNERSNIFLQKLAAVLIRSFFLGSALLLLWSFVYLIAPGWLFETNARLFDIEKRDFVLINYFGLGFTKISIVLLFLCPYLAIKWTLRKKK